jgi:hypothetical protein
MRRYAGSTGRTAQGELMSTNALVPAYIAKEMVFGNWERRCNHGTVSVTALRLD